MLKKASMAKELCLTVDNRVGVLNMISALLADRGINVEALIGHETADEKRSTIRLVADDSRRAADVFREKKIGTVEELDIVTVDMENKPGALASMTKLLTQKDINIRHLYATSHTDHTLVRVVLSTNNNEGAYVALKKSVVT